MLHIERLLDELVRHTGALADALHGGEPADPVPTCPAWTLRELAAHVGTAHRWAATMLERRAQELLPHDEVAAAAPPASADEVSAWLRHGAAYLDRTVRETGPDTEVAGFAGPVPARFWARRMAHETLVHRADAEIAVGRPPAPEAAPVVAADAISEGLWLLESSPSAKPGLAGTGQTLHLHATDDGLDPAGEWVIRREPAGIRVEQGHLKADVAVRGPAIEILWVLVNRRHPADGGVEVLGDAGLLAHWREHAAV